MSQLPPRQSRKRLILRLSSLGDIILASSSLRASADQSGQGHDQLDWVVAKEYAAVLRGHPRIHKLWEFDRRSAGSGGWVSFARRLWSENYDEVVDLHGSIRTRLLRILFFVWGLGNGGPQWTVASKQRFRSWGFIAFKKFWPRNLVSELQVSVFAKAAGGIGNERPDLKHLIEGCLETSSESPLNNRKYICVMPGSNWPGKTWSAEKYLKVLRNVDLLPVIMGTQRDPESLRLVELCSKSGMDHYSGVGKWTLPEVAKVLSKAEAYIGSDTGMAHLAEAVGTDVLVIYGPTSPGLGFEPWRAGSRTIGSKAWCRPCGKIGNRCYRPFARHQCLKELDPSQVLCVLREKLRSNAAGSDSQ